MAQPEVLLMFLPNYNNVYLRVVMVSIIELSMENYAIACSDIAGFS